MAIVGDLVAVVACQEASLTFVEVSSLVLAMIL